MVDFFNVENIGVRSSPIVESEEDVRASKILEATTKRIGSKFQTGFLWKEDDVYLPDSYDVALHRLKAIESKMSRYQNFSNAYQNIVEGYIEKSYVRKVPEDELGRQHGRKWYLPHFGVVNPNKPKKIRLVFDAAAQIEGVSLNNVDSFDSKLFRSVLKFVKSMQMDDLT